MELDTGITITSEAASVLNVTIKVTTTPIFFMTDKDAFLDQALDIYDSHLLIIVELHSLKPK